VAEAETLSRPTKEAIVESLRQVASDLAELERFSTYSGEEAYFREALHAVHRALVQMDNAALHRTHLLMNFRPALKGR
jgi:hypothetical protein